jgi:membrane-bound lytic murein transglycosylase A
MMKGKTLAALSLSLLLLAACAGVETAPDDNVRLSPAAFRDIPGWASDDMAGALHAFRLSCAAMVKRPADADMTGGFAGKLGDWQGPCAAAAGVPDADARLFFEQHFTPYAVLGAKGSDGLFTGYYQPLLRGSLEKKAPYLTPLYGRPADLVTVNLGDFVPEMKGKTVQGRVVGENLKPYHTRGEIEAGALGHVPPVVWVDDPVDAFFLHIQGSGVVRLDNGEELQVGYAAQNGHAYHAVGKTLVERGILTKEEVSMQAIRAWLEAHPAEAPALMNLNNSYVFFRKLDGAGPLGAQGVPVTAHRSLAVDRAKIPYGLPLFLDAENPDAGAPRLQRLMIAQDTGGAIKGAVRGDYFWGAGEEAADKAGRMKSRGRYFALLPKGMQVPPAMLAR